MFLGFLYENKNLEVETATDSLIVVAFHFTVLLTEFLAMSQLRSKWSISLNS